MRARNSKKWAMEKVWKWYQEQPWILGFNYVPSTAVNSTAMWQASTFDEETIKRELGWASGIGFNACRVFVQYLVWKYDAEGLKQRLNRFLEIAWAVGIRTMLVLFDDCNFDNRQPYLGPQLDPAPGVHNSRWTPSPGEWLASQPEEWGLLEKYVKDVVGCFASDKRLLIWDLYNEPGNCGMARKTESLLEASFLWSREMNPIQPITSGAWEPSFSSCGMICCEMSDIISFHNYADLENTEKVIRELKKLERPLLCTEWLCRSTGNRIETHLPLFKEKKIGIFNWGLVGGKTQTYLSWETLHGNPDPNPVEWQHDLLYKDGSPYCEKEQNMLTAFAAKKTIYLHPVEMTPDIMGMLEEKGLIIRLTPGSHTFETPPGVTLGHTIYSSNDEYGPHKLISVSVNCESLSSFGTHPDNEEFLLVGDQEARPMYLVIALCRARELEQKLHEDKVCDNDFICLHVQYNDPNISFFTMLKDVPHGEMVAPGSKGNPATFFVTEPRDMGIDLMDLHGYIFRLL